MSVYRTLFGLTLRRLLARRRAVGLIVLGALPAAVMATVGRNMATPDAVALYDDLFGPVTLAAVVPVIALVYSAAALGQDRRSGIIAYLVLKPIARTGLVLVVVLATVAAVMVVGGMGWLTLWVAGGLIAQTWPTALPSLVALVVAAVAYSGVFVPLGYLTGRATLAGLAYIFIWERILAAAIPALSPASLSRTAFSAYVALHDTSPGAAEFLGNVRPGLGGAASKSVVVAVVGVALLVVLLVRRDIAVSQ